MLLCMGGGTSSARLHLPTTVTGGHDLMIVDGVENTGQAPRRGPFCRDKMEELGNGTAWRPVRTQMATQSGK